MKKKILFSLLFIIKGFCTYIGNPSTPALLQEGWFFSDKNPVNIHVGGYGFVSSDEVLRFQKRYRDQSYRLSKMWGTISAGSLALNLFERFDLYLNVGSGCYRSRFFYQNQRFEGKSKDGIFYKAGAKAVIFERGPVSFGLDAQYMLFDAKSRFLLRDKVPLVEPNLKYYFKQWQIAAALSVQIYSMIPYIGLDIRDMDFKLKRAQNIDYRLELKERHRIGVYFGSSVSMGPSIVMDTEFHLINERSATVSAKVRF
jgi:hypothetical protein